MSLKIIEINQNVNVENDRIAEDIRAFCRENHVFLLNFMASPGAGKTSVLLRTAEALKKDFRIGVIEADIAAEKDAIAAAKAGFPAVQIHTGGECAMDAAMTMKALQAFSGNLPDLVFLENVGNLVCPAENDIGATMNTAILSLPEGDDKPLKYPLMFEVCQTVLINKVDTRSYCPFDDEAVRQRILARNPRAEIFFLSAKTGEGFDFWTESLKRKVSHLS